MYTTSGAAAANNDARGGSSMIKVCENGHVTGFRNCPMCQTTKGQLAAQALREKRLNSTREEWNDYQLMQKLGIEVKGE
jgi:hypothetical protein